MELVWVTICALVGMAAGVIIASRIPSKGDYDFSPLFNLPAGGLIGLFLGMIVGLAVFT